MEIPIPVADLLRYPVTLPPTARRGGEPRRVAFVGALLPKRSETFVYREVLGLRARGLDVIAVSVRPPEWLEDQILQRLAGEALVVYRSGMLPRALLAALRSPGVLFRGMLDAAFGADLPLGKRPRLLWKCLGGLALAWELRERGVEHVHAHMADTPTAVAMYAARALEVPFSFTGHAADLFRDRTLLREKILRAAFVACISEWHRDFYREVAGVEPARLPIVRCGVDVETFRPGPAGNGVLAVGRLVPKKGFDVLITAFGLLPQTCRPELTIVGDGPERARLEAIARECNVASVVHFEGEQPNDRVRALMQQAMCCVLPCRVDRDRDRDGIPVVLMEAMASGLPVVAGDLPTLRELVVNGESGLLVQTGNPLALRDALLTLLEDDALRRRLAAGGRKRVLAEFEQSMNLDRLEAAFARFKCAGGDSAERAEL